MQRELQLSNTYDCHRAKSHLIRMCHCCTCGFNQWHLDKLMLRGRKKSFTGKLFFYALGVQFPDSTRYFPLPSIIRRWIDLVFSAPFLYWKPAGTAIHNALLPFCQIGGMLQLIRVHRSKTFSVCCSKWCHFLTLGDNCYHSPQHYLRFGRRPEEYGSFSVYLPTG